MSRPWAYYNEFEPYAAEWIENLIRLGVVAPGIVDRRSIEDVKPDDLRGFRQCHFFAGIAVWSYALRRAGVSDDTALWTGSCPCQPFSAAGQGGGMDDERHLWPAFHHLIAECRPERVYGEQVASKDGLGWLDLVQTDMEAAGYAFGAVDTCSAGSGAPHIRQRLRFYAYDLRSSTDGVEHASRFGWDERSTEPGERGAVSGCESGELDHHHHQGLEGFGDGPETASGRIRAVRPTTETGEFGRLADAHGGDAGTEGQQRSGEYGQQQEDRGIMRLEHSSSSGRDGWQTTASRYVDDRPTPERQQDQHGLGIANASRIPQYATGPTNGFWRDADWLFCRDGKWRPVEPESFPLVDGATFRMGSGSAFEGKSRQGMLKAYGNAIDAEATVDFIEATLEHRTIDLADSSLADLLA